MSKSNPRSRPAKKRKVSNHHHKHLHKQLNRAMAEAKKGDGEEMRFWLKQARKEFPKLPVGKLNLILDTYSRVVTRESLDV